MEFIKLKKTSTVCRVWSDDGEVLFGKVGTVGDMVKDGALKFSDYPAEAWVFIPDLGIMQKPHFGATRENVLEDLPKNA